MIARTVSGAPPDIRAAMRGAILAARGLGWRVHPHMGAPPPVWSVPVTDSPRMLIASAVDDCATWDYAPMRRDDYEVKRYAGRWPVLVLTDSGETSARVNTPPFLASATVPPRHVAWCDTLYKAPRRVTDPGQARCFLRHYKPGRNSKRIPFSVLKRMAARLVSAPERIERYGVTYLCAVDLGYYAFDTRNKIIHQWGVRPGYSEGFAMLALSTYMRAQPARLTYTPS